MRAAVRAQGPDELPASSFLFTSDGKISRTESTTKARNERGRTQTASNIHETWMYDLSYCDQSVYR